jgi:hypothetical protein
MRPLFISYRRTPWAKEVLRLSKECRRRGLRTIVDLSDPDRIAGQAQYDALRQTIGHECDGFILYLTRAIVDSPCIWNVEVPAALDAFDRGDFHFLPVFRDLSPSDVSALEPHGRRISGLAGAIIRAEEGPGNEDKVAAAHVEIANLALQVQLRRHGAHAADSIAIAVRTRETGVHPAEADLVLDWVDDYGQVLAGEASEAAGLAGAVRDVCRTAGAAGIRGVRLCGPAHLSAAFAVGHTFARASGFHFEVAQREQWWAADGEASGPQLRIAAQQLDPRKPDIFVTMAISRPEIIRDVDAAVGALGLPVGGRLVIEPDSGARRNALQSSADARAIVRATADALMQKRAGWGSRGTIHIFMAAPFGFAALLGHALNGFGTISLYEPAAGTERYARVLTLPSRAH